MKEIARGGSGRSTAGALEALPLHVLVVDDSAVVRQTLSALFAQEGMSVTVASDPLIALTKMEQSRPDVVVLDLELPRMHGLTFLRQIMTSAPLPVVICSALTGDGTDAAVRALEDGAVAIVTKPRIGIREFLHESAVEIIDAVPAAARARVRRRQPLAATEVRRSADAVLRQIPMPAFELTTDKVVAIGASTGGTEALRVLLQAMPAGAPGLVIAQHMPAGFTAAFARRLDEICAIDVREAAEETAVRPGCALIAPGDRHLLVRKSGAHYEVTLSDGPLVARHRPSVDVLFRSVAQAAGPNALGALLTGMGDDGASGLLEMRQAGAVTFAQNEETCVVFGMPREAIARRAVDEVMRVDCLAGAILRSAGDRPQ
jgi:two-component system chemotaxis response regulator CheB